MKPILFNTEMVKAILDEKKTVTRRVVKPQPESHIAYACMGSGCGKWGYPGKDAWEYWGDESFRLPDDISQDELKVKWTPPCHTDDVLYVRETWALQMGIYWHKAGLVVDKNGRDAHGTEVPQKWRPSLHMPKEAARIFLRVTDIRAERLQDITYEECKAEGFDGVIFEDDTEGLPAIAINRFSRLWDTTIKKKDIDHFGWEANPWVWVIEFERISREEAMSEK